jgi:hypothetical protein
MVEMKKYIILDLQTADFSHHTTLDGIFNDCAEDYLSNSWEPYEVAEIEAEIARMTDEDKMKFVQDIYEYQFFADPDNIIIKSWEESTGCTWKDQ